MKALSTTLSKISILVVDDDELMLEIVVMSLGRLGVTAVSACGDGVEALSRVEGKERFDIVMLDLNMPKMDGIEVMRNLAVRGYRGGVLLFSGEDARILKTAQSLASAHHLNFLGCLPKPVTVGALQEILEKFEPETNQELLASSDLIIPDELRNAISEHQIVPHFQPKIRVSDRSLASVEVLARWYHAERGLIPPIAFVPVAEENGLINELTWDVFAQAICCYAQMRKLGPEFSIALNLSVQSLEVVDLPEKLQALADRYLVPCQSIILEITETGLMLNLRASLDILIRLRLRGFGLSIDDFGTGFSSMSQLSNVPFTELKIDRAFVHGSARDPAARAIMEVSSDLARKLDMALVAEGIEDESDWEQVAEVGCDLAQGYFIARPMPADQFMSWMKEWQVNLDTG